MFKQLDNLSPKIILFYKGYECHSSSISGIITLLTYITIAILGLIFSLDLILKRNPTSYFYNTFIYDIGVYSFNNTGIFHFIEAGDINNMIYYNSSIYIIGIKENSNIINKDTDFSLYDHWIYEPCNNQHLGNLKDYINHSETPFYKSRCINKFYNKTSKRIISINNSKFKYPTIEHGSSNPNSTPYGIFILRCKNNKKLNKTNCDEEEISDKKAIELDSINIFLIDHFIDVTNYRYPLTNFYHKISNKIALSSYTTNHLNFNPLKLNTHAGIIMNTYSELHSFNFDLNEKLTTNEENTGIYGSFYFWMQNQMNIYDRTYQKIQDVSASISGISKLLLIIGYFINYLFAKITLINDVSNDILKKNDKYNKKKKIIKAFKLINKSTCSNNLNTEFPSQISKQKNISTNKRENKILYNNMINDDISKSNFKEYSNIKINIKSQKITIKQIICHHLCCIKNNNINNIENIRKKILSEEQLFLFYSILETLNNTINQQNKQLDLNNNKVRNPN